eukprot:CAMPEP_0184539018 /NCGR_PEP_ID=MMETSP0198_2-20121128/17904_1 /TAXON_ID=1112570 /ORGANISM="Thraustochytrium sp., Strain LLF1b" /LENGTH=458 /DNA_ID=CAMNT_0026932509 /DNA_START=188 /DNA_END=1564 /DNA_ORIENTATION=-
MAGDSQVAREKLKALGLINPLVKLLDGTPFSSQDTMEARRTAAWALCNLARGSDSTAGPFCQAGADRALLNVVRSFSEGQNKDKIGARELVIEACWTLAFLSAKEPECCAQLAELGGLTILVPMFVHHTNSLQTLSLEAGLITPALRAITNILPIVEPRQILDTITSFPGFLRALAQLLSQEVFAQNPSLCKEALWTVSNCCSVGAGPTLASPSTSVSGPGSSSGSGSVSGSNSCSSSTLNLNPQQASDAENVLREMVALFQAPITRHLLESPFEIQREAAFALFNLVSRPTPEPLIAIVCQTPQVIPAVLQLLEAPDFDVVKVALDIVELVLAKLSNPFAATRLGGRSGSQLVILYEGLESVQFAEDVPEELSHRAAALVDKYFGEDYDEEELEEVEGANHVSFPNVGSPPSDPGNSNALPAVGRGRQFVQPAWVTHGNLGTQTTLNQFFNGAMQEE